jgi:hypothetical protein
LAVAVAELKNKEEEKNIGKKLSRLSKKYMALKSLRRFSFPLKG